MVYHQLWWLIVVNKVVNHMVNKWIFIGQLVSWWLINCHKKNHVTVVVPCNRPCCNHRWWTFTMNAGHQLWDPQRLAKRFAARLRRMRNHGTSNDRPIYPLKHMRKYLIAPLPKEVIYLVHPFFHNFVGIWNRYLLLILYSFFFQKLTMLLTTASASQWRDIYVGHDSWRVQ